VAWVRGRRPRASAPEEKPVPSWPLFLASLAALVVLLGAAGVFFALYKPPRITEDVTPITSASVVEEPPQTSEEQEQTEPHLYGGSIRSILLVAAGVAALLLLALVVARAARASREHRVESEERLDGLRRELTAALRVSLEAIFAEEDCRQAVIACYLRMEQGFGAAGLPRAPAETPFEFLERVAREAGVAGPGLGPALAVLTRLYELARFSQHLVRHADRSAAVRSLRELEEVLAGGLRAPQRARP